MNPADVAMLVFALVKEAIAMGEQIYQAETERAAELTTQLQDALQALLATRAQTHADAEKRLAHTEEMIAAADAAAPVMPSEGPTLPNITAPPPDASQK